MMNLRYILFALSVFGLASRASYGQTQSDVKPNATSYSESVLASFCVVNESVCPRYPQAGVAQGEDGIFYGTTMDGGAESMGAAYTVTSTGVVTTLHSFCEDPNCSDGEYPTGSLIQGSDGNFYGADDPGEGTSNDGLLFKLSPAGEFSSFYDFCAKANCADGSGPSTNLIMGSDGNFYGVTNLGGAQDKGTVFRITPAGSLTTLYSFCSVGGSSCTDGAEPFGGLVQGSDGNLYGTTEYGGSSTYTFYAGTVFRLTPAGVFATLHSFCTAADSCPDGEAPASALVEASDGNFYGTTISGGSSGQAEGAGTAFRITPSGTLTTLHIFCESSGDCADGANTSGLNLGSDGNLYGATSTGNSTGGGTAFQLTTSGTLTTIYAFCSVGGCADGSFPTGGFIQGSDGVLYGTAQQGGDGSVGAVFKLTASPALPAPAQLALTSTVIDLGKPVSISWQVLNAYSLTMQQCYAFVQGGVSGAGNWAGFQLGKLGGGVYSGATTITPTAEGTYSYALTCGGIESGFATLTVTAAGTLAVSTTVLETGSVGVAYSTTLQATGGTPPYKWSVSAGSLPGGLSLSSAGVISGKPTTAATSNFTVEVKDSASHTATQALSLTMYGSTIVRITTASLPNWTVGKAYSATMAATSGTKPYTWSVYSGSLPAGLSLNASTGVISGTPTTAATTTFFIGVKGAGANTATAQFTVVVSAAPVVGTTLLETGAVGFAYATQLSVEGGTIPYVWSVSSGSLPVGLSLNASTGVISGTPTTAVAADSFTIKVTDAAGATATQASSLTIYIADDVRITTTSLPNGTVGTAYSATLEATSGTKPYTWSVYSGSLPAGLSLAASTGVISGMPTEAGTTDFFIGVKGAGANTATASLTITVAQ
jgi:uncharacterized repeat protein (TIGR03803 family)